MLAGPARALFMDEISTGLDSSTTFQIVKFIKHMVRVMDGTVLVSLLQPAPETYNLFDDIILLSEGQVVYHGPREHVLEFFESAGFKCPERKGIADFLQEVTSKKDQEQYWVNRSQPYRYISVREFAQYFKSFHVGLQLAGELKIPYDKSKTHPAALVTEKYGIPTKELLKAVLARGWLLMKRNSFVYIFKTVQITILSLIVMTVFFRTEMHHRSIADGSKYFGALFFSLIIIMFNGFAELSMTVSNLPVFYKQRDSLFFPPWVYGIQYWILRIPLSLLDTTIWMVLTYYVIGFAPSASRFFRLYLALFMVHQMALSLFRFIGAIGRSMVVANTIGTFSLLVVFVLGGSVISKAVGSSQNIIAEDDAEQKEKTSNAEQRSEIAESSRASTTNAISGADAAGGNGAAKRGMVLPFQPLSLAFNHVNYYVDMPAEMKSQGAEESRLQLLCDVSSAFRPGVLTALVGVSGAGKSTLMDVLAGRKTGGYIEGDIRISGYPKKQETFARISGYCEQNDIHSPNLTMFADEVMQLVELDVLKDALVGLPGVDGLSTEQRKRLTIAVELVANPSIIFMDEPTSGLDARAAAIVMRTVRNTVNTGRTVVCTIHQPSIDIFESFDELLLLKRGGQVIYAGELGRHSYRLIEYFQAIPGIPKIPDGYNPATWMLEISTPQVETHLNIDFAEVYAHSSLYQRNQELIKELSIPAPGSKDLSFPTKYSQSFTTQCMANFWKQYWSYWRNPQYNAIRFFMTTIIGLIFGTIFWNKGKKTSSEQDLTNLLGAIYAAVLFLGASNSITVQPVVGIERTVFYREKAAGMYSPLSYAFAQVSIEIIYNFVQTIIYVLLIYSMIGFTWHADKFFYFFYFLFMCFNYFTMYGMMVVAATPSHHISGIVSSFLLSFWNLFSGFVIPRPLIPVWWRWYYWGDPVAWTIYGVITSQLGDKENNVSIPGSTSLTVKEYLRKNQGYKHDFLGYVVLAHLGFVLIFFFIFGYSIKFLNFQKR
uniref:ABC transporter domain-containing protein n=1 Tax=Ananas comosus var. bracteatus TaxID=296719 RepID=A0A6V7NH08_ANACO|nr:unnamed protein product [Ananas comosus var. bracteatus]